MSPAGSTSGSLATPRFFSGTPDTWAWIQGENIACDYPALVASLGGQYINESDELLVNKEAGVQTLQMMSDWLNVDKIVR